MYITMFNVANIGKKVTGTRWLEGIQKEAKQMTNNKNRVYAMLT